MNTTDKTAVMAEGNAPRMFVAGDDQGQVVIHWNDTPHNHNNLTILQPEDAIALLGVLVVLVLRVAVSPSSARASTTARLRTAGDSILDDVGGGWQAAACPLKTRWASDVTPDRVLPEYPRPQLVRRDWRNLNGLWDYAIRPRDEQTPAAADDAGRCSHPSRRNGSQVMDCEIGGGDAFVQFDLRQDGES